ncbi:MAG: AcrR family transcriptional regulator, partial [Enterobacterales bacterium]
MNQSTLKERIIIATLKELETVEVSEISLRKISKQLEVTAQAPYHYFPNKDALLLEVKLRALSGLNWLWQHINDDESDSLKRLENLGVSYANYFYSNVGYYKVLKHKMQVTDDFKVEIKRAREMFISAAEDVVRERNIENLSAEHLTLLCWSSVHGLLDLHLQNMIAVKSMKSKD